MLVSHFGIRVKKSPTCNLVVRERVTVRLVLEPLQTEQVDVSLVGGQITNLPALANSTLDTSNGDAVGALVEKLGGLFDESIPLIRGAVGVVSAMMSSNSDLEQDEEGEKHGEHASRLAVGGHGESNRYRMRLGVIKTGWGKALKKESAALNPKGKGKQLD
jgi:hypothetical protein